MHKFPLLWLIVIVGAAMRIWGLEAQSFWLDELFSRANGLEPSLADVIEHGAAEDVHPPGYPLLSYLTMHVVGGTEFWLRLPSALAGIATIVITYLLGRRLWSERVGLTAAALMSVHWFAVHYSQEHRPYSLLLLMTGSMGLIALRLLQHQADNRSPYGDMFALACFGFLSSYLHYFGLLWYALLGLTLFALALRKRIPLAPLLLGYGVVGLGYLPWVRVMLTQVETEKVNHGAVTLAKEAALFNEMSARHPLALAFLWMSALYASYLARRRAPPDDAAAQQGRQAGAVLVTVMWIIVPVVVATVISVTVKGVFTTRNLIGVLPGFILLSAVALEIIETRWMGGRALASSAVCCWLLFELVVVRHYYTDTLKEPFRQLTQKVIAGTPVASEVSIWVQPSRYGHAFNQYFEMSGSPLRATGPEPSGARLPRVIWVLSRGKDPSPPEGGKYRQVLLEVHEPNKQSPWPGKKLAIARYERSVP